MQNLVIQGTNKTPSVEFNTNGELKIEGRSIPENSYEFYKPVTDWINSLSEALPPSIKLIVNLEYINTSSSKLLLDLFNRLEEIYVSKKTDVEIIWLYDYDDDDSREEGQNFKADLSMPFVLKAF